MDICGALNPRANEICIHAPHQGDLHSWVKPITKRRDEVQTRERDLLQLAMFMQARDARPDGLFTGVTWEMIEMGGGQEEYLKDAEAYLSAIEKLGYHK